MPTGSGAVALRLLRAVGVDPVDPESERAYSLAVRLDLAADDAASVALAEAFDAPLWSGERALCERTAGPVDIRWVGE